MRRTRQPKIGSDVLCLGDFQATQTHSNYSSYLGRGEPRHWPLFLACVGWKFLIHKSQRSNLQLFLWNSFLGSEIYVLWNWSISASWFSKSGNFISYLTSIQSRSRLCPPPPFVSPRSHPRQSLFLAVVVVGPAWILTPVKSITRRTNL